MKEFLAVFVFAFLACSLAEIRGPQVEVYTRLPEEFGKANDFICHVSFFNPPLISIKLLNNGKEIPGANQTDLAFAEKWDYHLTKFVSVRLDPSDKLECRVEHMGTVTMHALDLDL